MMETGCTAGDTEHIGTQTLLWGTWELWCDLPCRDDSVRAITAERSNWLHQVKSIGLFDSAEGFWGLFNCTLLPSQLPPTCSYYMFRKHIAPMWEHEANRRGGKWIISFSHKTNSGGGRGSDVPLMPVDIAWQRMCLGAIGELFPGNEEEICGVTVSRGKGGRGGAGNGDWKLCVWTRSAEQEVAQRAIAAYIKELLDLNPAVERGGSSRRTISYTVHRELMEAKQCFAQKVAPARPFGPRYTV